MKAALALHPRRSKNVCATILPPAKQRSQIEIHAIQLNSDELYAYFLQPLSLAG